MIRRQTVGIVEACLCCPDIGYICRIHDDHPAKYPAILAGLQSQAITEEMSFPSEPKKRDIEQPRHVLRSLFEDEITEL